MDADKMRAWAELDALKEKLVQMLENRQSPDQRPEAIDRDRMS